MTIPTYDRFIEPLLRLLDTRPGGLPAREAHEVLADRFGLSDVDRQELLPSGAQALSLVPSHHDHAIGERIGIRLAVDHVVAFRRTDGKRAPHDHVVTHPVKFVA